jgi:hypothetical protein
VVAAFDPLGELDLLRGGEKRDFPDVLEEELERVGRDLGVGLDLGFDLGLVRMDDGDLRLVERGVELVELSGLELELVERECDLVRVELAGLETALEQPLSFVGRENVLDGRSRGRAFWFSCDQTAPLLRRRSHRSRSSGRRQKSRVPATIWCRSPGRSTARSRASRV